MVLHLVFIHYQSLDCRRRSNASNINLVHYEWEQSKRQGSDYHEWEGNVKPNIEGPSSFFAGFRHAESAEGSSLHLLFSGFPLLHLFFQRQLGFRVWPFVARTHADVGISLKHRPLCFNQKGIDIAKDGQCC